MSYLTIGGIVSVVPVSSPTSYIGYGSTGPLTINSTAGVLFCNSSGDNLGTSISSSGILNSNGLVVSGSITCNTLNITDSTGTITSFGTINSSSTITTNAVITCNTLTATGSLTTASLICNGPIIGFSSFTGTSCPISNISSVSTGSLTCANLSLFTSFTGNSCTISNNLTSLSGQLTCTGNMTCSYSGTTNIKCPSGYTISIAGPISGSGTCALTTKSLILTGASSSTGNLYVGSGFKCAYDGTITGVGSLNTTGALSASNISCNKFICNTSGVVSGVTTLNMSGQLNGTGSLNVGTFSCSNVGVVTITIPTLTLKNLVCNGSGFKCTSAGAVSNVSSLTISGPLNINSGIIKNTNNSFVYDKSAATITAKSLKCSDLLIISGTLTGSSYNGNNTDINDRSKIDYQKSLSYNTNVTTTGNVTGTSTILNFADTFKLSNSVLKCTTLTMPNLYTTSFKIGSSSTISKIVMGATYMTNWQQTIYFPANTFSVVPRVFVYGNEVAYNRVYTVKALSITINDFYCIKTYTNPGVWNTNGTTGTYIWWVAIVSS